MAEKKLYGVKEVKVGGKRGRICRPKGTKAEVVPFANAMRKIYKGKYTYRVVRIK